jgi:hypothetical protein
VPTVFRQRLGDTAGKQRVMQEDGHLLVVLHRPPVPDEVQRAGRYFWRKPDGAWQGCEPGGKSITLPNHLAEYAALLDKLDHREDAASTAREYFSLMSELGPLHRATRHMHAVLQEAREAVPEDRELINLRDRAYDLERSFELLHTDTKNGLDFAMARQAEEQAAASHRMAISAHRLNLLAAFFFPLATLSAVLGVNMQHGYERLPGPQPFLTMVGIGLIAGLLLMVFVSMTRPKKQSPHT